MFLSGLKGGDPPVEKNVELMGKERADATE
jgi:hypothetical protein